MVSYRAEVGEETERRGAVDPERQEVLQLGVRPRLHGSALQGSARQVQRAQERVELALGEGTCRREDHTLIYFIL